MFIHILDIQAQYGFFHNTLVKERPLPFRIDRNSDRIGPSCLVVLDLQGFPTPDEREYKLKTVLVEDQDSSKVAEVVFEPYYSLAPNQLKWSSTKTVFNLYSLSSGVGNPCKSSTTRSKVYAANPYCAWISRMCMNNRKVGTNVRSGSENLTKKSMLLW